MSAPGKPKANRIGLPREAYTGGPSTLCPGCGHDSITNEIVAAFFELGIPPHRVAKFSGIGCSSKTPGYFLSRAQGLNGTHGRMPSVATGANLANRALKPIGVTGDGDTASIGLGQFCHLLRRNVELVYVIENNGVYGLTKGQFSATADLGSEHKSGGVNQQTPIDCCRLAIEMGCGFVARGFSADRAQMVELLKAALNFPGTALIDAISPCVTFNNHPSSTKSYAYVKAHEIVLHEVGFVEDAAPLPDPKLAPGETRELELHGGARIRLKKLAADYDPTRRLGALQALEEAEGGGAVLTGLLYFDASRKPFAEQCRLVETPLAGLPSESLRLPREALNEIMADLM
ncbi:MAG: 2-oxoacid:ferredoxin oxidoreductase subunit beta [Planctomycetota bacterium]|nr:2-oxoacid:ferredoxin oxidoreductase subunit beta [Planctomycetota bacterium]